MTKRRKPTCRGCGRPVGTARWPSIELTMGPVPVASPLCLLCAHDFMHRLGVQLWTDGHGDGARDGYLSWCTEWDHPPRPGPWDMPDSGTPAG